MYKSISDPITVMIALIMWFFTAYWIKKVRINGKWSDNKMSYYALAFMAFFAASMTLDIKEIYPYLDTATLPNLSRFVSYILTTLSFYSLVYGLYRYTAIVSPEERKRMGWFPVYTGLSLIAFAVLYLGFMVHYRDLEDLSVPTSLPHLLFMGTVYLYMCVASAMAAILYWRQARAARQMGLRLRLLTTAGLGLSVLSTYFVKTWISVLIYTGQARQPEALMAFYSMSIGACAILLVFVFLPSRVYQKFLQPVLLSLDWIGYNILILMSKKTAEFCPEAAPIPEISKERFTEHQMLYRHKAYASLQDHKLILKNSLDLNTVPQQLRPKAQAFYQLLGQVDDSKDTNDEVLIPQYQKLGIQYYPLLAQGPASELVAEWVSRLFHPLFILIPTFVAAMLLNGASLPQALLWTGIATLTVNIPILFMILYGVYIKHYSDFMIPIRQQRHSLYIVCIIFFGVLLAVLVRFQGPKVLLACLLAGLASILLGFVINHFTKISMHALALAGCTAVLLAFNPILGGIMVLLSGLVGWARVRLGAHTLAQVVIGWSVAVLCVEAAFRLLL